MNNSFLNIPSKHKEILTAAIKDMLEFKGDARAFKKEDAIRYQKEIGELFSKLLAEGYLKIENKHLEGKGYFELKKQELDYIDKADYFLSSMYRRSHRQNHDVSLFQYAFYTKITPNQSSFLGLSLYLMVCEHVFNLFEDETLIRSFADLKNKGGIRVGKNVALYTKMEIIKRLARENSTFLGCIDRNLRNSIAHFDFDIDGRGTVTYIKNNRQVKLGRSELRNKVKQLLWLNRVMFLTKFLERVKYIEKIVTKTIEI
ncbi:MAG: hypothetical protein HY930_06575 [Euryarchaeota archaeon]|nr:hypothetical protein [Euryarchaeota archaeon]